MIPRHIETALRQRMSTTSPAVVLLGPRQVGKTTLARKIAADCPTGALYLDTERPADRRRLDEADAYLRAQTPKLVVIDEIHRVPELFATLRGIIHERRQQGQRFGHFLLLGSAALDLMRQASETLAGRVAPAPCCDMRVPGGIGNDGLPANTPTVSSVREIFRMPRRGIRPWLGLKPTSPFHAVFSTVIELRATPGGVGRPSVNASSGRWHVAHEVVRSPERMTAALCP